MNREYSGGVKPLNLGVTIPNLLVMTERLTQIRNQGSIAVLVSGATVRKGDLEYVAGRINQFISRIV